MNEHAFLAPSSAARWVRCAMSPTLEAAYPETEASPASLEGTAAHWVVQMLLQGTPVAIDTQAPNGVAVTDEMLEAAILVQEDIVTTLGENWRQVLVIEKRVQIKRVHESANWGTPDYYAWTVLGDGRRKLIVWDFKYGHGIVEAFENWQLIDYVAGILGEAEVNGLQDQNTNVDMRVIQPRAFHRDGPVRSWLTVAADLRGHINRLSMAADDAMSVTPTASPHPVACENCRGRHACEALQRAAYFAADYGQQGSAVDLTPHALGLELRALTRAHALLEARMSGLQAQATSTIAAGKLVPFWNLESKPGNLKWTKPTAEILALGQMMGLDLAKPVDVITPAQAKKAGLPDALCNTYAIRPTGSPKLIFDDGSKTRLTFSSSNA